MARALLNRSTADGGGAQAHVAEGDVALGSGSLTTAASPAGSASVGIIDYPSFAANAPTSVVSIGAVGNQRQIPNVAAGRVSATSTDAINGSPVARRSIGREGFIAQIRQRRAGLGCPSSACGAR